MNISEEPDIDKIVGRQRVSIIIPCRQIDTYVKECIAGCFGLTGVDLDILVLPDSHSPGETGDFPPEVVVIDTGPVLPGVKRNIGTRKSSAEIVAYIDADAYPRADWLEKAITYLSPNDVGAVGGRGLTPPEDSLVQQLSGEIYASPIMGRVNRMRYVPGELMEVSEVHSCNLIAKREVVSAAGGWSEVYWPGEDTLLCSSIIKQGKKILYGPDVQVYHHRRSTFKGHLKQVWRFGVHRGYFFKRFPAGSRRLLYLMPSALLLYLLALPVVWILPVLDLGIFALPLVAYLSLALGSSFLAQQKLLVPLVWFGVIVSHIVYGAGVIKGLLSTDVSQRRSRDI